MQAFERLEHEFADFIGNPNVVVCSSGSAALHLALEAYRHSRVYTNLDTIVIPDITMIACARAAVLAGYQVRFADVNYEGLMDDFKKDVDDVVAMPVHLYGRRCFFDSDEVDIIEDMAEASGLMPNANAFASCWSFYTNKIIAGEEGGAIAFRDKEDADYAKSLRCLGMRKEHNFIHNPRGMNYRLSNAHARLISKSLKEYPKNISKRKEIQDMYNGYIPLTFQLPNRAQPWVYDLVLPEEVNPWSVVEALNGVGISARMCFQPMSVQPEFWNNKTPCENAKHISEHRMYLPIYPDMTDRDVEYVVEQFDTQLGKVLA